MNPLLPAEYLGLLVAGLLAAVAVCSWKSAALCAPRIRWTIVCIRLAAVLVLAVIAFNPGKWREDRRQQEMEWVVLLDSSRSMDTKDVRGKSRWAEGCRLAEKILAIRKDRRVKLFTFASKLQPLESEKGLSGMKPDGESTDIIQAGKGLLDLYESGGKRLAGMIILSDGRQIEVNNQEDIATRSRSLQSPIFAIGFGSKVESSDLAINSDRRQYIAFKGRPLKITAKLSVNNLQNISPVIQLVDDTGRKVAEHKMELGQQTSAAVDFEITPEHRGYEEYTVKVLPWPGESTLANNQCRVGVAALEEKIRVLMVEGMPAWDSKFIAQLLQKQKDIHLVSLYRLSSDKYLSIETDENKPGENSENVFPEDAAAFRKYDLIIFGRCAEYFLTTERINLLKQFVRDHGGGVLFARGKPYAGSFPELESLEPITWGHPSQGDLARDQEVEGDFSLRPTPAGEEAGLFSDVLPGPKDPVWDKLPSLSHARESARSKAFSQVLANGVAANSRAFPVVISQRYGKGLVITVNLDGLWQWDFFPAHEGTSNIYRNFWCRLAQWAVTYSDFLPGQEYSLRLSENIVSSDQPVMAKVTSRSADSAHRKPILRIFDGRKPVQEILLPSSPNTSDQWEGVLSIKEPGTYRVELTLESTSREALPHEILHVKAPPSELDEMSSDTAFLQALAEKSGGRMISEDDLANILDPPAGAEPVFQGENPRWEPMWSRSFLLAVILFLFGTEWLIRRRNGLI